MKLPAAGKTQRPGWGEELGSEPHSAKLGASHHPLQAEKVGEPLSHPHSSVREKPVLLWGAGIGPGATWVEPWALPVCDGSDISGSRWGPLQEHPHKVPRVG